MIKLPPRLQAIADLIPAGSKVADIGTDHGYIPVWLVENGISEYVTAADINKGPLDHARMTAAEYGVSEKINFELCSGLEFSAAPVHDTVIVAGMGGELILSILEKAPWTAENCTLILQPNSRIQVLVAWLQERGYAIGNARLVKDAGKLYQILVVSGGEEVTAEREADRLIHPCYFARKDPLLADYLDELISRYESAERGMLSGKRESPELAKTRALLCDLRSMRQDVSKW